MMIYNSYPTVEVLMSTYNGEEFIQAQIDSIFSQKNVNIHVSIRDDGSVDHTVDIIKMLMEEYPGQISCTVCENVGYQQSFLYLIKNAKKADYYAFSDQDDIWLPGKLEKAIEILKKMDDEISLYASALTVTNKDLEPINQNSKPYKISNIESYFTRARIAGCTFVFTPRLREIAGRFYSLNTPRDCKLDHDFVVGSCAFSCGKVYIDSHSYILHRRLRNSATSGGNGLKKRIQTEYNIVFNRKHSHKFMANALLKKCGNEMLPSAKKFLTAVSIYDKNLINTLKLVFYKGRSSSIPVCDLEQFVKIIIRNY